MPRVAPAFFFLSSARVSDAVRCLRAALKDRLLSSLKSQVKIASSVFYKRGMFTVPLPRNEIKYKLDSEIERKNEGEPIAFPPAFLLPSLSRASSVSCS